MVKKRRKQLNLFGVFQKLQDISGLLCKLFTWITCQVDAASPRHAGFCVCHLASIPPPAIPEHVSDKGHRSGKWTSGAPVQCYALVHTPHRSHLPFHRVYIQLVCVWWFGSHAWWSSGSLRPDYWPTNQLADHMDGNLHSALHSTSPVLPLTPPRAQVSPPRLSTPADLLVLFNESLGSPALRWKFHPRHPPCVTLCFIFCSWWRFRGTGRRMMHGNYKILMIPLLKRGCCIKK